MSKCRFRQCAALPFRLVGPIPLVLLVTSRETRRWIIPKGWIKKSIPPGLMAAQEAYEEAGVLGTVTANPMGDYRYLKRLPDGSAVLCEVAVFPLEVTRVLADWPEKEQRERCWLRADDAAGLISDDGLVPLFRALEGAGRSI